jgi:2-hydroxy-3-oxopropionate reductase
MNVGFIGLGIMGRPMSLNLLKAGFSVNVLSRSAAAAEVAQAGARSFSTVAELAAQSDVIISMLPDSPQVEELVFGEDGLVHHMKSGSLFIDMSTITPSTAKNVYTQLASKGIHALDAPVSGGQAGAEGASLTIMVGGDQAAFDRALPLFQAMGKTYLLIGPAGSGQMTKACNQIIVGMTIQAVSEAFALAKKSGVDLVKMREVLLGGFAQSRILDLHGQRIIDGNFKPGFKVKLHRKDLAIALQTSREHSVSLFGTAQVATLMDSLIARGQGEDDHSSIFTLLASLSGIDNT